MINVATGGRISLNELFATMRELVGGDASSRRTRSRAPATSATRRPTSARRGALLGYEPIVDFEEGLRRTVEWYRSETTPAKA